MSVASWICCPRPTANVTPTPLPSWDRTATVIVGPATRCRPSVGRISSDAWRTKSELPTAFLAEWSQGEGGPKIGFLGEYDALPGLSQDRTDTQQQTYTLTSVWTVEAYEEVKTPAGTFKAFKVTRREIESGASQELWYSPEVKSWIKIRGANTADGNYEEELTSFTLR